ncbi:melatonin receptor type 1B-like [Patiria miniata]|uniref:G-protein coupled receptors family 1 profile domain-containing protein n=1 Tax=Patiria miniata TaxID=46514 RepID=A0A913ZLA1_PATMI|nr:melatonin receptor type 1B-like [Patiria miniata]
MDVNTTNVIVGSLSGPLRVLYGSAVILACILGITGNGLVILSIATTPKLRTSHNAFVFNLSIANLLLSVFTMPFYATAILAEGWPLSPSLCRLQIELSLNLWQVSVLTLAAVATNRYLLVAKSAETYSRFCGFKQIAVILFLVWLEGLSMSLLAEFVIEVDIRYVPEFSSCALNPWHSPSNHFITALISILVMTVMIIIPVQYFRVLLVVRASRQRVGRAVGMELSTAGQQQNGPRRACPNCNLPGPAGVTKEEIKLIKMFILLSLVYTISYLPISIVYLFVAIFPVLIRGARFGAFVLSIAPAVNPVVYAWMNRGIRKACYRLLRCKRMVTSPRLERQLEQA